MQLTGTKLSEDLSAQDELRSIETPERQNLTIQVVSAADFAGINAAESQLQVIPVKDLKKALPELTRLMKINEQNNSNLVHARIHTASGRLRVV